MFVNIHEAAWALQDQLWARRSYARIRRHNATRHPEIEEGQIRFGPDSHQVVFWFAPRHTLPDLPLVIFVHGGGWQHGDPSWHRFIGKLLAADGFACLVAGYRLAPAFRFPAQLEDLDTAVEAGFALMSKRGWSQRPVLIGQSAGAHLAALLAFGHRELLPGSTGVPIAGLVLLAGPLSFAAWRQPALQAGIRALAGPELDTTLLEPLRYLTGDQSVAALCVHGAKDYLVPISNSTDFIDRMNERGGKGELLVLPNYHHADLLRLLYEPSPDADYLRRWIIRQK